MDEDEADSAFSGHYGICTLSDRIGEVSEPWNAS